MNYIHEELIKLKDKILKLNRYSPGLYNGEARMGLCKEGDYVDFEEVINAFNKNEIDEKKQTINKKNSSNLIILKYYNTLFKIDLNTSEKLFSFNAESEKSIYETVRTLYRSKNGKFFFEQNNEYFPLVTVSDYETINYLIKYKAPLEVYNKLGFELMEG